MTLILRDYQKKVIEKVVYALKQGNRHILMVVPTGGGKTAIATHLAKRCIDKGNSLFFICHRTELIDQTDATFKKSGIEPAFIQGGRKPDISNKTQIASVNTLVHRLDQYEIPKVVIWDEAHHIVAGQWSKIFNAYSESIVIGLTATPIRLDGKCLGNYFDVLIEGHTIQWLIDNGFLVPFKYYAPSVINTKELKKANGDYTQSSLAKASFGKKIIGDNITHYQKIANGKRNLIFAMNVKHSESIAERYNRKGIPAKHLDGNTPKAERKQAIKDFESGKIKVLTNVDLFGEGFDLPAIEVLSLLRPTMSLSLFLQWCGRGLRPCPEIGKTKVIILDHVNNYEEHGFPNEIRKWSLNVSTKKERISDSLAIRRCPQCYFAHRPSLTCPNCSFVYGKDGKIIKEIAGELVLIDSIEYKKARQREYQEASTFEEFAHIDICKNLSMNKIVGMWKGKSGEDLKSNEAGYQRIAQCFGYEPGWAYFAWKNKRKF